VETDDRDSKSTRPQTITRDLAGKWIAWSEDGLRIVAVGDSFDDCERKAVAAGYSPNLVGIMGVPESRGDDWGTVPASTGGRIGKRILLATVFLAILAAASFAGFLLGLIGGESGARDRRFSREGELLRPVLKGDPAFARLEVSMYSGDGSAYLSGQVETNEQYDRLRSEIHRLFGKTRDLDRLCGVSTQDR
jgi:hypothetical protein